ncbi:transcriptional regulator, partial [Paramuricea clavata]
MANNFDMNDMTVEQLMALSEIIDDSDYEGNLEDEVNKISEDKFYRVAPKDKGENIFAEEKLFIDEGDRATDPKRPRRLPLNYKGKRGIMPTWKYSERQKAKALLVEEAYQSLLSRGVEGLPPTMGGRWRTDDPQVNAEMKRLENLRNPKRSRGRPQKVKVDGEVTPKRRGRPPKAAVAETKEVKVAKRRGRPPKAKAVETREVTVPKRRGRPPKARRQTVAERFVSQGRIKLSVPTNSVITQVGPNKFTVTVDLSRKPTRKAPEVPKGVTPWKPVPKPRTVLPKEIPVPKPRIKIPNERPIPKPRTKKPVPPPKLRKPARVTREVVEQPVVVTPEEHEIDPFGTYLDKPYYRKIETAANGAAVTYSITPNYMDPLDQMTA